MINNTTPHPPIIAYITDLSKLANGYFQDHNVTQFTVNFNWGNPAGGVVSTLNDIQLFLKALANGSLFQSTQTLDAMMTFGKGNYGLGVQAFINNDRDGLVWGHDGGDPGYFSYMIYIEDKEATIIFAGNRADIEVENPAIFVNQAVNGILNR